MKKKLVVILICVGIVLSTFSSSFFHAKNLFRSSKSDTSQNVNNLNTIVDPDTSDSYRDLLINDKNGTRYAGRIWSDKSVFNTDIILDEETDGWAGKIVNKTNFLHTFSLLGSSQKINNNYQQPIDLVITLDMSASMAHDVRYPISGIGGSIDGKYASIEERTMEKRIANSRIQKTLDAVNKTIDDLMNQNPNNRVSVIVYGAGATVIMPLAHYKKVDDNTPYLKIGGMETLHTLEDLKFDETYGWVWMRNGDACYTIEAYTLKDDNDNPTYSSKDIYKNSVSNNVKNTKVKANPGIEEQTKNNLSTADSNEQKELKANTYVGYLTNTQGGIYLAYAQLAKEQKTTLEVTLPNKQKEIFARVPAAIIMSDGSSNFAFNKMSDWQKNYGAYGDQYQNEWNQNWPYFRADDSGVNALDDVDLSHRLNMNKGDEWYNVYLPGIDDNNSITSLYNGGMIEENGTLTTIPSWNHAGILFSSDNDILATSGTSLELLLTASYMKVVVSKHYEDGWNDGNALKTTRIPFTSYTMVVNTDNLNQWEKLRLYPTMDPKGHPLVTGSNWWANEQEFGPEITQYGSYVTKDIVFNGMIKSWNDFVAGKQAQANMSGADVKIFINPIPKEDEYNSKFNVTVTNQEVIDHIAYNDGFYDVSSDDITEYFNQIVSKITGNVFVPIAGVNDSGVSNAVTYMDPIGKYMTVKDKAVSINNNTYDMALLLFGEIHGIKKTAMYDYQFNDKWMKKNNPNGFREDPMKAGWYSSSDPETAKYLGSGQNDGSWDEGNVYYLDYPTAIEFLPTLSSDGIKGPDDLSLNQKNTKYTFYRLVDNDRGEIRSNPSYDEDEVQYKLTDIRVWVEDTGDYQTEAGDQVIDNNYDMALYTNIPTTVIPLQVATITTDIYGDKVGYQTNLENKSASTPLRLFYGVGLSDDILTDDKIDIDITKVSQEYLKKYRVDGDVPFYSNYYSNTNYDGYVSDSTDSRTRGDASVTFSASNANRYYVYQNLLTLYKVLDTDSKNREGGYDDVGLLTESEYQAFLSSHEPVTEISDFDPDKWYYVVLDYYTENSKTPVHVAVARKGQEFGSSMTRANVVNTEYITWYNPNTNATKDFDMLGTKPEGEGWVVATKPGGVRTGDLAQSRQAKSSNRTGTSYSYYLPVLSKGIVTSEDEDNIIIVNSYLGNNGKVTIEDTSLLLTKELTTLGGVETDTFKDESFEFAVKINNIEGDRLGIYVIKNPYNNEWQLRISTIDILTDNEGFIRGTDKERYIYTYNGQKYYMYIGDNITSGDTGGDYVFRLYSAFDNDNDIDLKESGVTTYVSDPNTIDNSLKTSVNKYKQADNSHPLGLIEFWVKNVRLVPIGAINNNWKANLTSYTILNEVPIVSLDSNKKGLEQLKTVYDTSTIYLTKQVNFGYSKNNKPTSKPDSWTDDEWNNQVENTAKISLKSNEGIIFTGLDSGTKYTITENLTKEQKNKYIFFDKVSYLSNNDDIKVDNQTTNGNTESGTLEEIHYINKYYDYGDLSLTKIVSGEKGDKEKEWTFDIILTSPKEIELKDSYDVTITTLEEVKDSKINLTKDEDGKYKGTIKLKHGQTATIKDLPISTSYQIIELEADKEEYKTTKENDEGILKDKVTNVKFENINYGRYDLTISKKVLGDLAEKNKDWNFDIVLIPDESVVLDKSYNYDGSKIGTLEFIKQDDGYHAEVALKHGETITIKNLPEKTHYIVKEIDANKNGYATTYNGNPEGILDVNGAVEFVNTKYSYRNLTINKQVLGSLSNKDKEWTFEIILTPDDGIKLLNTYEYDGSKKGTITFKEENGKYKGTVSLKHGETITIKNLPDKTQYVIEEKDINKDGYTSDVINNQGILTKDEKSIFINKKLIYHNLTISKEVQGLAGDKNKEFTFNIILTPMEYLNLNTSYEYEGTKAGDLVFNKQNNGTYIGTIKLSHDDTVTLKNIPEGTKYEVQEVEANLDGYITNIEGNTIGTINNNDIEIKYINKKISLFNLSISKVVEGTYGDKDKEWKFLITLLPDDPTLFAGTYNVYGSSTVDGVKAPEDTSLTFEKKTNGTYEASITLKHGQTILISDLPEKLNYHVEEVEADQDGYSTTITGENNGVLEKDSNINIIFKNKKSSKYNLTINKQVKGNLGEKNRDWKFKIVLTPDKDIKLKDLYMTVGKTTEGISLEKMEDGTSVGYVTLKHNESITILDLPENTTYEVIEIDANKDGYISNYDKVQNTLGKDDNITFINTKLSNVDISISKNVYGNLGEKDKEWIFMINLVAPSIKPLELEYSYTGSKEGNLKLETTDNINYQGSITLHDGELITIHNLPEGTKYTIEEIGANLDGYTTNVLGNTSGILDKDNIELKYSNIKYSKYNLSISKEVSGNNVELDREWNYNIILKPDITDNFIAENFSEQYTYTKNNEEKGVLEFTKQDDGTYLGQVTLKHGEYISIEDIPYATEYQVVEVEFNKDGYKSTTENNIGTLKEDISVKFINTRNITIPDTLDNVIKYMTILFVSIIGIVLGIFIYRKAKS